MLRVPGFIPANALSKTILEASQVPFSSALFPMARSGFGFRLGLSLDFRAGPVFGFRLGLGWASGLGPALISGLVSALAIGLSFSLRVHLRLFPAIPGNPLCSRLLFVHLWRVQYTDQVWRGFELDVDFSREGFVERILYCRTLFLGQVKRAAHEGGFGGCFKGPRRGSFSLGRPGLASV